MKFLYYLACIGDPNLDLKLKLLSHNLTYLHKNINTNFDVMINSYETSNDKNNKIKNTVQNFNFIDEMFFFNKKGVLTEVFLTNTYNINVDNYDYICFVFDDIKIENIDIYDMIQIKLKYNIEIFSPKVINSTWNFMNMYNGLTFNNFLEIYFLLLSPNDLHKFFSLHTIENKWTWGVDFLFGYLNINSGVINKYSVKHMIPSKSNKGEGHKLMMNYLKEKTPFKSLNEIRSKYKPIKDCIII